MKDYLLSRNIEFEHERQHNKFQAKKMILQVEV